KVANFLAFNLERNYKSVLAKPVQNGYTIEWFSNYYDLKDVKEFDKDLSEKALSEYWNFIGVINAKVNELQNTNNENHKNWSGLLQKVFHHNDNFRFFNGSNICIIWGWKFENTENYVPNYLKPQVPDTEEDIKIPDTSGIENSQAPFDIEEEEEIKEPNIPVEEDFDDEPLNEREELVLEDIDDEEIPDEKEGFLAFLKWFASKYWWSLILLMILIMIVLFFKTLNLTPDHIAILSHSGNVDFIPYNSTTI